MAGRFIWSSTSDYIGRKNTYFCFFALGTVLYALVPYTGAIGSVALFVFCYAVIFSMYGGGFATVPAYLRDMFGTRYVGAIHGLLLTAWSTAGIFGPVLVNYIRQYNVDPRRPAGAGLQHHHVRHGRAAGGRLHLQRLHQGGQRAALHEGRAGGADRRGDGRQLMTGSGNGLKLFLAWTFVGIPLTWGVVQTLVNAIKAFQ